MKKKMKLTAVLLSLALCFAMAACTPPEQAPPAITSKLLLENLNAAFAKSSGTVDIEGERTASILGQEDSESVRDTFRYNGNDFFIGSGNLDTYYVDGKYYAGLSGQVTQFVPPEGYAPAYTLADIKAAFLEVAGDEKAVLSARKNGEFYELTALRDYSGEAAAAVATLKKYLAPVNGTYLTVEQVLDDVLGQKDAVRTLTALLKLVVNLDSTVESANAALFQLTGVDFLAENPELAQTLAPYAGIRVDAVLKSLDAQTTAAICQALGITWFVGEPSELWLDSVLIEGGYNLLHTTETIEALDYLVPALIGAQNTELIMQLFPDKTIGQVASMAVDGMVMGAVKVTAVARFDLSLKFVGTGRKATGSAAVKVELFEMDNSYNENYQYTFSNLGATTVTLPPLAA